MKKYLFEDRMGERYIVRAENEQDAWEKFTKQCGYTKDNMDILANDFTLNTVDMRPSSSPEWFHATAVNKQQCEEYNGIWVPSHKQNHTIVQGYCRRRPTRRP